MTNNSIISNSYKLYFNFIILNIYPVHLKQHNFTQVISFPVNNTISHKLLPGNSLLDKKEQL